jgi:hypothetical protein
MSTTSLASSAMSCVRSTGKPKVSHSTNASWPLIWPLVEAAAAFLKRSMPLTSVRLKLASSSRMVWRGGGRGEQAAREWHVCGPEWAVAAAAPLRLRRRLARACPSSRLPRCPLPADQPRCRRAGLLASRPAS